MSRGIAEIGIDDRIAGIGRRYAEPGAEVLCQRVLQDGVLSESDRGPELTGTGGGELFAYFPSITQSTVAKIEKTTGQNDQSWAIPGVGGELRAWAFAHWGGDYFIFVSHEDIATGIVNQVHRFDRKTGKTEVILDNTPYRIVGAGVSTCAPLLVQ